MAICRNVPEAVLTNILRILAVEQRGLGVLIEEVEAGHVKRNGDVVIGAGLAAGINAGNNVAFLAGGGKIEVGFGAHELDNFYVYLNGSGLVLLNELGVVVNVLGTNAHVDFLIDALVGNQLLKLLLRNEDLILAKLGVNGVAFLLQLYREEVHLRAADESGNKQVGRIVVQVLGGVYLLNEAVLHNHDAGAHGHSLGLVVGNVNEGGLQLLVQLGDFGSHLNTKLGVQVGKR